MVFNEMDAFNGKLKEEEKEWEKFRGYEEHPHQDDVMSCIDTELEKEVRNAAARSNQ